MRKVSHFVFINYLDKFCFVVSDAIWSCDMNFLYDEGRASKSNLIGLSNITILHNYSFIAVPTVKPEAVGWQEENPLHVAFVHLSAALIALTVKYASVFWFTNKVFGALFSLQLLFMTIDSLFAFCGISVLYKVSINSGIYQEHIHMVLSSGAVLALYILGGIVLLFSSIFLYDYGGNYFQEKFKLIDKHHHPEAYRKQTIIVHGSCQGYKTHTFAMASLIFVAVMKGPILYDLVSLYRATKDPLILSCIIIDVCYMVSWIVLWTILTLKQQWQFRILDYVPLNQPIYMVSNDPLIKSASFHGGSLELQIVGKKRPSSLPSELTTSESGFGDVNSSEDEKERFELSLPPLAENPGGQLRNSRRKGSTHSLDRKGRYRRNINQRVTFRDTVKRSTSNEDNLGARQRTNMNITADVHRISPVGRPASNSSRSSTPIDVELICSRNPGYRHSLEETAPRAHSKTLNNQRFQISLTEDNSARTKHKDINTTEKPHNFNRDFNRKNDYTNSAKSNLISSNIHTQTTLNNADTGGPDSRVRSRTRESPNKETNNYMFPRKQSGATMTQNNRLQPRPLEFIDKTQELGLSRRDSANYSLTSSQETASNESELIHQLGICSQV